MVFDAGSSHTSLYVYEWDSDKENDTGVVSQTLSCDVQGQYPLGMGSQGRRGDLLSCSLPKLGTPSAGCHCWHGVTWLQAGGP